jgi:hypothetical protein
VFEQFLKENGTHYPLAKPQAGEMCVAIVMGGGDPAVALGFFDSRRKTTWVKPVRPTPGTAVSSGTWAHSRALRCRTTATNGSFNAYDTWAEGAADWPKLLQFYKSEWKLVKLEDVLYKYAPWADRNNPPAYIAMVKQRVNKLRTDYWAAKNS